MIRAGDDDAGVARIEERRFDSAGDDAKRSFEEDRRFDTGNGGGERRL